MKKQVSQLTPTGITQWVKVSFIKPYDGDGRSFVCMQGSTLSKDQKYFYEDADNQFNLNTYQPENAGDRLNYESVKELVMHTYAAHLKHFSETLHRLQDIFRKSFL